MPAQWTCLLLAGQRPGTDPLADHFGMHLKALVPLNGKPMLTRVIRTLEASAHIGRIFVLAQDIEALRAASKVGGDVTLIQSAGGISLSIKAQIEALGFSSPFLITTADHPLLTVEMIDEFLTKADGDLAVAMVEQKVMLAQFPDAKRTWLRFNDGAWSGANLFALMTPKSFAALDLWAAAEQDRKKAWKLFSHFGVWLAFRAVTRTIGLETALEKAGQRIGLSAKLVPMSDPVAAIDVDKLSDHQLAETILTERVGRSTRG